MWSCNVSVSQQKFYIYIKKISINLIEFDSIHDMKTPNEKYRLRVLKKKKSKCVKFGTEPTYFEKLFQSA